MAGGSANLLKYVLFRKMSAKSYLADCMRLIFCPIFLAPVTLVLLFLTAGRTLGQVRDDRPLIDTTERAAPIDLDPVYIRAFIDRQPLFRTTAGAAVLDDYSLRTRAHHTLLPALNAVPGVRMEERSPGSYRLSVRGSLLRSPFGVRNLKVYMDEIPLTDAGGNTYFNLLDPGAVSAVEILKGPDGSLFGANSGGVVIFTPSTPVHTTLTLQGGSYGLLHQQLGSGHFASDRYRFSIYQSYQRADGYRDHTGLRKHYIQTQHQWNYRDGNSSQFRLLALYGDLDYRTPGGLTEAQYENAPRDARPATPTLPGSEDQKAGIRNRTFIGGLTHEWFPNGDLRHVATVFGSHTDFRNPFITNYEKRAEHNLGLRTYLSYRLPIRDLDWLIRIQAGAEWQRGRYSIHNFDNHAGDPGAPQAADRIRTLAGTSFLRMEADYGQRWIFEGALSHNTYVNHFEAIFPPLSEQAGNAAAGPYRLPAEWMPRLAFSYRPATQLVLRTVLSKGFSPPTTAEIRASDNVVNTALNAESGWNLETGLRFKSRNGGVVVDLSLFRYRLRDAIVRSSRESGAEYFRNAGRIGQLGLELSANARIVEGSDMDRGFPRLNWAGSWAWSHFRFLDYRLESGDFSGNALTGVPRHTVMNALDFHLSERWAWHVMYQYVTAMPLDDANTVYADPVHLLQARLSHTFGFRAPGMLVGIFVGADNLLDKRYSLGHDINAFGGRYFNAAPDRNYYGGISLRF